MRLVAFVNRHIEAVLAGLFISALMALSIIRGAPVFEPLTDSILALRMAQGTLFIVIVVLILRPRLIKSLLTDFLPIIIALAAYEGMKHMHATALTLWMGIEPKDALMLRIDEWLFGKTPYLYFADWGLDDGIFIRIMSFMYALYYVGPFVVLAYFTIVGDRFRFLLVRRGVVFCLYGGYISYIFIPVGGPLAEPFVAPLYFERMTEFNYLMENFRYAWDCFPSLHTAVPWLLVFLSFGAMPKSFIAIGIVVALGITTSTMALRFHYGIDVIAGVVWAVMASMAAMVSLRWQYRATPLLASQTQVAPHSALDQSP